MGEKMTRTNKRKNANRRGSLLKSMEKRISGGSSIHEAKRIAEAFGGSETVCTMTGHYRTFLFKYPGCHLSSDSPDVLHVICETETLKATIVANPVAYFEKGFALFPHYKIDAELREGVAREFEARSSGSDQTTFPLFLVIEQYESLSPLKLDGGNCFLIDECRDGKQMVEGGREGEKALLVIRALTTEWPKPAMNMHAVNAVLAAVKIEKGFTFYIEEIHKSSCFVSDDGRVIHDLSFMDSIAYGGARTSSPLDVVGVEERASRIRAIHQGISEDLAGLEDSKRRWQIAEVIDSVLWVKGLDDAQFRLWYLRLWQALNDARVILGNPKFRNDCKDLTKYRNDIAHFWTGRVDYAFIEAIQKTAVKMLREKYT